MNFVYKAVDKSGKKVSGEISAHNRLAANSKLSMGGLRAFLIEEKCGLSQSGKIKKSQKQNFSQKIKLKREHVLIFTEELGELMESGIQLETALGLMEKREANPLLKQFCGLLRSRVRDGEHLSEALQEVSPSFSSLYCNLALAGESSGTLGAILQKQAQYLLDIADLRSRVLFSMIYPSFLLFSGLAVGVLFITYLTPKLAQLIETTGGELPGVAKFLIFVGDFFKNWGLLTILLLVIGVVFFYFFIKKPKIKTWWDEAKLALPFFGKVLNKNFQSQFLQTLSILVNNGISLDKSLRLAAKATTNSYHRRIAEQMADDVEEGGALSTAMKKSATFSDFCLDMVSVGEQTGKLGMALKNADKKIEKLLRRDIEKLSALAQPVIIIVLAGVVGVIAYIMISVIYETIGSLRKH